ncbi:glycosyltransferase family 4 protein [Myxococcota bacterium]|nr:glycosyltransferase family 4 protein [Myxococcota bacterium]
MSQAPSILLGLAGLNVVGGIACVSRCIARALDEAIEEGSVELADRILLLDEPDFLHPPPLRGHQTLARGSQRKMVWQLWRAMQRTRYDLVFFDHFGLARATQLPLPGLSPSRYAIFCHGIEIDALAGRPLAGRAIERAWRVLVNSDFTRSRVQERFPAVADRIRVTPLCIDPQRLERWQDRLSNGRNPSREMAVLIVGRVESIERGKGHETLIEAWPEILRRVPGAQLWVVGDGNDRARIEAEARRRAPPETIHFFGEVDDAKLSDLYQRASVFAMPSRQEGFGLVYAEAMWHGLPCIGSTQDAARDLIEHQTNGLLVTYGSVAEVVESVCALLTDTNLHSRLSIRARETAQERFTYDRFGRDFLSAMELLPG